MATEINYTPATMGELLATLAAGGHVLDVGCGRGSFAYAAYPHLVIEALDEYAAKAGAFPPHVRYRRGAAEALPYGDAEFDLVIANFVMEHVADFPAAIDQVARVLRPGGHFYMSVPNARSFEDALYRSLYAGGGHVQRHSFESVLATVYARTDLKLVSYIEWPAGFSFLEDREGLRAFTQRMAEACREALGVDLRARSNYLFVFQRQGGRGRPVYARVCTYCGAGTVDAGADGAAWTCAACGRENRAYAAEEAGDARLDADMRALWDRHPHLRPATDSAALDGSVPPVASTTTALGADRSRQPEQDLVRRIRLALRMLRRGRYDR